MRRNPFSRRTKPGFLRNSKCVSGKSWRISVLDCSGRENARPEKEEGPKQKKDFFVAVQQKGKRRRRTFRPTRRSPLLFNSPFSCVFGMTLLVPKPCLLCVKSGGALLSGGGDWLHTLLSLPLSPLYIRPCFHADYSSGVRLQNSERGRERRGEKPHKATGIYMHETVVVPVPYVRETFQTLKFTHYFF